MDDLVYAMKHKNLLKIIFVILSFYSLSAYAESFYCAHPDIHGFYVGGQFGYAKTDIGSLSASDIPTDANNAVSTAPMTAFYAPDLVVPAVTNTFVINTASVSAFFPGSFDTNVTDKVIGGRIFVGYRVLYQLAIELGYLHVRDQNSNYSSNPIVVVDGILTDGSPYSANFNDISRKDSFSENAWDLNVKAFVPLYDCFDIYAKLGVAYLTVRRQSQVTLENSNTVMVAGLPVAASPITLVYYEASKTRSVVPTLGLGVAYNFSENLSFDLSWYRIAARSNQINKIDFLSLGFIWQFPDVLQGMGFSLC